MRTLIGERTFDEVVVEIVEESVVADERPTQPLLVGLQSILEQVWSCLVQETAEIIGLLDMGGVGKTTLLTLLNNKGAFHIVFQMTFLNLLYSSFIE